MQQPTYDALPEDVKTILKGDVVIDPTVPLGQVKNVATGELMPAAHFTAKVRARARKKRERQNRKAGRARR